MFNYLLLQSDRRARFFRYAPLFLWIGLIFFLSSNQGSMTNTSGFIRPFLEWLFPQAPEFTLQNYHVYIRKLAHLSVYFVLGLTAFHAFALSRRNILRNYWFHWQSLLSFPLPRLTNSIKVFLPRALLQSSMLVSTRSAV